MGQIVGAHRTVRVHEELSRGRSEVADLGPHTLAQ
jgi:hypothetical protein